MGCSAWPEKKEEKTGEWKMAKVRFHSNSLMLPWKPHNFTWICLDCCYGWAVSQESWWINQVQWNTLELWWNIDHKKSRPHCCTLPREDREFKDSGDWNLITILIDKISGTQVLEICFSCAFVISAQIVRLGEWKVAATAGEIGLADAG